jgi:hypothetical protein
MEQHRRYLSVIYPLHILDQIGATLFNCLEGSQLNRAIDYLKETKWPEIIEKVSKYDAGELQDRIDLKADGHEEFPPVIPEKVEVPEYTTPDKVQEMIDLQLHEFYKTKVADMLKHHRRE